MTWFAFAGSGSVYNLTGLAEKELVSTGAHGYATAAEAKAHPNGPENPEQSILLAEFQTAASSPVGGGTAGVQSGTANYSSNFLGTLAGFLGVKQIFGHAILVRGAKIVIGGLLLVIGLVHITGVSGTVADAARKVPVPI